MNNKWVKSQKVVNFPFNDFDPTPYLASVPQETILRHKELLDHQHAQMNGHLGDLGGGGCDEIVGRHAFSIRENDLAENAIELDDADKGGDGVADDEVDGEMGKNSNSISEQMRRNSSCSPIKRCVLPTNRGAAAASNRRKRLVSTSLTQTPVIDGEFKDFHNHQLEDGQDPYDLKYQLYAVVVSVFNGYL